MAEMKLFVDDIRNAPDDTWTVARSVSSAINAISQFNFDVISLDHDISHQIGMGELSRPYPCEETFYPVAQFIVEKYKNGVLPAPQIILHTSNPVGAAKMESLLYVLDGIVIDVKPMGAANRLEAEV